MWLVVADFLVSDPLFLRSGNDVPVNLYQMNVIFSVLTRKGKVPRHNFHPPKSQSRLIGGRSQLVAPSGPGSHTLPSCHPCGSQAPKPTGPHSPQAAQMGSLGLIDCDQKDSYC